MTHPDSATKAGTPLLALRDVHTAYGRILALKGVNIDVHPGEIVALIGANGAGKSTMMMTVFGKPQAQSGQILFDGQDITHVPTHHISRLRIAQSPEGRRIFPRMSVKENLLMGVGDLKHDPTSDLERVLTLWRTCRARYGQEGPFLFSTFSIADCMFAPMVTRFVTYDVAVDTPTRQYMDAMLATPEMVRWTAAGPLGVGPAGGRRRRKTSLKLKTRGTARKLATFRLFCQAKST